MKRLATFLLALVMCLSMVVQLAAAEDAPVELTIAVVRRPKDITESFNEKQWVKDAEAALNLKLSFVELMEGAVDEPLAAILAGDLPDVFFMGLQFGENLITQNAGLFRPVTEEEIKTYAPTYYDLCETYVDSWREYMTYPDGKMYGLMGGGLSSNRHHCQGLLFLNEQWLENLGLERPTTLEEFYDVLVAFRDQDANGNGDPSDEIPLDFCNQYYAGKFLNFASAWGMAISPTVFYNVKDGVVEGTVNTPAFREFLEYYYKLGQEGLINLEGFTQTTDQYSANLDAMKVGAFWEWSPASHIKGDNRTQYKAFVPVGPEGYQTKMAPNQPNRSNRNGWVITRECEEWETALKLYDYWCEPARSLTVMAGAEGIGWVWMDEEAMSYTTPTAPNAEKEPEAYAAWNEKMKAAGYEQYIGKEYNGKETIGYVNNGPLRIGVDGYDLVADAANSNVIRIVAINTYLEADAIGECIPKVIVPAEAQEELDFMTDGLAELINGFTAESVINGVTDESWNAFQSNLEKYNYSFYLEWYNKLCRGEL